MLLRDGGRQAHRPGRHRVNRARRFVRCSAYEFNVCCDVHKYARGEKSFVRELAGLWRVGWLLGIYFASTSSRNITRRDVERKTVYGFKMVAVCIES